MSKEITIRIVQVVVLLIVALSVASCGKTEWDKLNERAQTLFKQGRYVESIEVAKDALKVAEETFGSEHPKVATAMVVLARPYKNMYR